MIPEDRIKQIEQEELAKQQLMDVKDTINSVIQPITKLANASPFLTCFVSKSGRDIMISLPKQDDMFLVGDTIYVVKLDNLTLGKDIIPFFKTTIKNLKRIYVPKDLQVTFTHKTKVLVLKPILI